MWPKHYGNNTGNYPKFPAAALHKFDINATGKCYLKCHQHKPEVMWVCDIIICLNVFRRYIAQQIQTFSTNAMLTK